MVLRTLGYVLGAESALLLLPLLVAALYREDPVPFLIPLLALGVCALALCRIRVKEKTIYAREGFPGRGGPLCAGRGDPLLCRRGF